MLNKGMVVYGLLGGLLIGAVLGLLIAPEKGSYLRKRISQKANDAFKDFKEDISILTNSGEELLDDVRLNPEEIL